MDVVLVLIYTNLMILSERRPSLETCYAEAKVRVGDEYKPLIRDSMNGSNPIPKVALAFCVNGAFLEQ